MDSGYVRISFEVADVQREQMGDGMNFHGCGQPRIMNLDAGYGVSDDQAAPFMVSRFAIR